MGSMKPADPAPRHQADPLAHAPMDPGTVACDGTACHFAGAARMVEALLQHGPVGGVRCLGHCYSAPAFRSGDRVYACPRRMTLESWIASWGEGPEPAEDLAHVPRHATVSEPVVLRNLVHGAVPTGLGEYDLPAGEAILAAVERAALRGRGGARFPTAAKWRMARETPANDRWVVANGDEGDPGSYVDRLLLEEDPHAVLAGMVACARVVGASRGLVYVRGEYPRALAVMRGAIAEAREAGKLAGFEIEVRGGIGSYLCGEETALIETLEGRPSEPRPRPPYPAQVGLQGLPTVVHHVETLAMIPWVARTRRGSATKVASLAGAIERPGLVEVALGTPLRSVLERAGGGAPAGRSWKMALVGGPLGHVLPEKAFDTPLSYEALPGLGHAGVVLLDRSASVRALAEHLYRFYRSETCGICPACADGAAQLAVVRDRAALEPLLESIRLGSLCFFGQSIPRPVRDLLDHFEGELFA